MLNCAFNDCYFCVKVVPERVMLKNYVNIFKKL